MTGEATAADAQPLIDELEMGALFLGSCAVELPVRHGVSQAVRTFHDCLVPLTLVSQLPHEPTVSILQRSGIADAPEGSRPEGHALMMLGVHGTSSPLFLAVLAEIQRRIEQQRGGGGGEVRPGGGRPHRTSTSGALEFPSLAPPAERSVRCSTALLWLGGLVARRGRQLRAELHAD